MRYAAFGMNVDSEARLHLPCAPADAAPDVVIRYGSAPECTDLPFRIESVHYGVSEGCVRVHVESVADFLIRGDRDVLIALVEGASPAMVSSLVTGLVLGIVARRNTAFALHGSAVVHEGKAAVLLGGRGSGKSTTAAALCQRGYRMLCDDMVPIGPDGRVWPGVARPRLTADAYRRLFGNPSLAADLWDGVDKYQLDVAWSQDAASRAIVFVLEPSDCSKPTSESLSGWKKVQELARHLQILEGLDDPANVLRRASAWIAGIRLVRIRRPAEGFRIGELLTVIESELEELP